MDPSPPALTARFWRTRRSAAIAGIVFAVLMLTALTVMRLALGDADPRRGCPEFRGTWDILQHR
jgi:hypothetical protein